MISAISPIRIPRCGKSSSGAETRITYQITLEPTQMKVEKLNVALGNISLSAEALLQDWRTEPIIKDGVLSSELPLTELIPLVPWRKLGEEAKVIRQSLAGGGKVVVEKVALPELHSHSCREVENPFVQCRRLHKTVRYIGGIVTEITKVRRY